MQRTPVFFNSFILFPWNKKVSDVIIQTNKLFIFRNLLNFTTRCIGRQIKIFTFLFVPLLMKKYKRWKALMHGVIAKQRAKREKTHPVSLPAVEKCEKVESVNTQNDYETSKK